MPSLKSLKDRINSVVSTQKITNAMRLIAGARLRHMKAQLSASNSYIEEALLLSDIVYQTWKKNSGIHSRSIHEKLSILTDKKLEEDVSLYVVVTADRGLCGSFNEALVKSLNKALLSDASNKILVLCVGHKGYEILKAERSPRSSRILIEECITGLAAKTLEFSKVQKLAARIFEIFKSNYCTKCWIVSSHFASILSNKPSVQQLLPISMNNDKSIKVDKSAQYAYDEPITEEFITSTLEQAFIAKLYQMLLYSLLSEHSTRMVSMEGANNNSREILATLRKTYNKARQYNITKELIEIVSGVQALE